ncbi:hypothetical protein [Moorena sp. SIO4G3]|uniref:hypothetical protein n=1 Tax=Moorena sp. SIO4G3 TaxID=2607821 RepID=UPI0025DE648C|nr:hypothetical protein [Moorena sp. SIO4G3]
MAKRPRNRVQPLKPWPWPWPWPLATLREWPRYANGHATRMATQSRSTFNLINIQPST